MVHVIHLETTCPGFWVCVLCVLSFPVFVCTEEGKRGVILVSCLHLTKTLAFFPVHATKTFLSSATTISCRFLQPLALGLGHGSGPKGRMGLVGDTRPFIWTHTLLGSIKTFHWLLYWCSDWLKVQAYWGPFGGTLSLSHSEAILIHFLMCVWGNGGQVGGGLPSPFGAGFSGLFTEAALHFLGFLLLLRLGSRVRGWPLPHTYHYPLSASRCGLLIHVSQRLYTPSSRPIQHVLFGPQGEDPILPPGFYSPDSLWHSFDSRYTLAVRNAAVNRRHTNIG